MKVVINVKYGGFSISTEALFLLIKENSPLIKKETIEEYFGKEYINDILKYTNYKNGFKYNNIMQGYTPLIKDNVVYSLNDDYDNTNNLRSHPDLISVVLTLGDKSWGSMAELKIIEIPDNIDWYIDEYDGMEKVCEKHREWS